MVVLYRLLVFLCLLVLLSSNLSAQQVFEATFKKELIHCGIYEDGSIKSGRMKNGVFKTDATIEQLRKRIIRAKKTGDSKRIKLAKDKLKQIKARLKTCVQAYVTKGNPPNSPNAKTPTPKATNSPTPKASSSPTPNIPTPTPTTTPIIPTPGAGNFSQALAVIRAHCASCHLNTHSVWNSLQTEQAWLGLRAGNGEFLINQNNLAQSLLLQRIRYYGGPNATMPLPNINSSLTFSVNDYAAIRNWILGINGTTSSSSSSSGSSRSSSSSSSSGSSVSSGSSRSSSSSASIGTSASTGSFSSSSSASSAASSDQYEPSGNDLSSNELFQCSGSIPPSPKRYRRLDNKEWTASLGLQGTEAQHNPLVSNPHHQFSTYSAGETFNPTILEQYFVFLPHTENGWIDGSASSNVPRPSEHACMIAVSTPNLSCITNFLRVYLKNYVFFRQPTTDELNRLITFAQQAIASGDRSTQAGRSAVMQLITSAAWTMTGALFRSEVGQGQDLGNGVTRLSNEELGKALAFTLTDQGPGAPNEMQLARVWPALPRIQMIENAVDTGSISTPATLDSLVAANFAGIDPNRDPYYSEYWMGEKIERFFRELLEIDALPTSFHDTPQATSPVDGDQWADEDFNEGKKVDNYFANEIGYGQQLIEMIARVVSSDQQVFSNLFTSPYYYLPSNLDSQYFGSGQYVYGVFTNIQTNRAARWNDLSAIQYPRRGILSHPAWLATHGSNFENGPSAVLRGRQIREKFLCQDIPDTPITVDASFPPSTAHLSARQRLELATGSAYCQGCHGLMNPLGLAFERYNHAGFPRASDHGSAPNGAGAITFSGDPSLDGPVANDIELGQRFSQSPLVEKCLIRQSFRFFMGRPEKQGDACTLVAMRNAYQQSNGSMKSMLQTLIKSPAFLTRTQSEAEE